MPDVDRRERAIRKIAWEYGWSLLKDDGLWLRRNGVLWYEDSGYFNAGGECLDYHLIRTNYTGDRVWRYETLRPSLEDDRSYLRSVLAGHNRNLERAWLRPGR